jgi:2-hydroxycyclohexanecarboxyl-CoA dehydrogenase
MDVSAERTAVLTGAASPLGIGRATAERLAREGWAIGVLDVDGGGAEEAAAEITRVFSVPAIGVRTDVSDRASVDAAMSVVEGALPPIVGLVNLAGISSPTDFMNETSTGWDRVFSINMTGAFNVTQRALGGMIERRFGRVVSLSSISAERGGGSYSKVAYSASKAAIIGFTRALAREMGEYGITVNAVAPGPIDTEFMGGALTDERRQSLSSGTLVGRMGTRSEVAAVISFLLGADAGFITGATYDVNGGLHFS